MNVEDHIPEFLEIVLTVPDSFAYFGDLDLGRWGFAYCSHRDSDSLTTSNWRSILSDAQGLFPDSFEVMECSHWAVGWMNHLMIDTHDKEAVAWYVENVWLPLQNYPVYDEDDLSWLETELEWKTFENCCVPEIMLCMDDLLEELEGDLALGHALSEKDHLHGAAIKWLKDQGDEVTHILYTACEQFFDGSCGSGDDFYVSANDPNNFAIMLDGVCAAYRATLFNPEQQELPL